jgi:Peptidase family M23
MTGFYLFLSFIFISVFSGGRPSPEQDPPVRVIHFFNEKTMTYDIYCANESADVYSIELDFEELEGLKPSSPYPLRQTIPPGTELILRLTQKELHDRGHFKVALTYRKGFLHYAIAPDFPYLLPLRAGSQVQPVCKDRLVCFYPDQKESSFEVYAFPVVLGDTVFAARRGVVCKMQNLLADSSLNETGHGFFLDIQHADGTYGRYEGIEANPSFVEYGQEVEAGDPIALVGSEERKASLLSFRVFYYTEKVPAEKICPDNTTTVSVPVHFEGLADFSCHQSYTVVHPLEVITKEMNRKDLRRWMRRKSDKSGFGIFSKE